MCLECENFILIWEAFYAVHSGTELFVHLGEGKQTPTTCKDLIALFLFVLDRRNTIIFSCKWKISKVWDETTNNPSRWLHLSPIQERKKEPGRERNKPLHMAIVFPTGGAKYDFTHRLTLFPVLPPVICYNLAFRLLK